MSAEALPVIAKFVANTNYDGIPPEVLQQTKRIILDTIGVGLAGFCTETGKAVRKVMGELGGKPESTVIASGERMSCANAAFANSKMANALDMDDCFANYVHFAPVTVFAPFAVGERLKSSGKDLLTAVALGYDIAARVGLYGGHLFYTGSMMFVCHIFGGAVGAAKLLNLTEEQMINAIGTAALFAPIPPTMKGASSPVTWVKYADAGQVAWSAIVSCLLAREGYRTNPTLFEGDNGYWVAMRSNKPNYEVLTGELGKKWWIMESAIKPYPSCRYNHNPVDLFKKVVSDHGITIGEIERVTFKCSPAVASPVHQWCEREPRDSYGAQFSIPHCIAMAAFNVPVGPQWQTPESINDPKVKEFRQKVYLEAEPQFLKVIADQRDDLFPKRMPVSIEVVANGNAYRDGRDMSRGDPWSPETRYTDEDVRSKFIANAANVLSYKVIRELIDVVDRLEEVDSVGSIMNLLVGKEESRNCEQ